MEFESSLFILWHRKVQPHFLLQKVGLHHSHGPSYCRACRLHTRQRHLVVDNDNGAWLCWRQRQQRSSSHSALPGSSASRSSLVGTKQTTICVGVCASDPASACAPQTQPASTSGGGAGGGGRGGEGVCRGRPSSAACT